MLSHVRQLNSLVVRPKFVREVDWIDQVSVVPKLRRYSRRVGVNVRSWLAAACRWFPGA